MGLAWGLADLVVARSATHILEKWLSIGYTRNKKMTKYGEIYKLLINNNPRQENKEWRKS
jgi:hypothetical protein